MFTVSLRTDSSINVIIKHVDETVYKLRRDPSMTVYQIIAVFMAKKGFEWAGELHQAEGGSIHHDTKGKAGTQPA